MSLFVTQFIIFSFCYCTDHPCSSNASYAGRFIAFTCPVLCSIFFLFQASNLEVSGLGQPSYSTKCSHEEEVENGSDVKCKKKTFSKFIFNHDRPKLVGWLWSIFMGLIYVNYLVNCQWCLMWQAQSINMTRPYYHYMLTSLVCRLYNSSTVTVSDNLNDLNTCN